MGTKKVDSRVCNIKVYVGGKSAELQKNYLNLGASGMMEQDIYKILTSPFCMSIKRE